MNYRIIEREAFKVIGRRMVTPEGGGTWDVCRKDGSLARMTKMETGQPFLGLCFGFEEDGSNDYMVGMEYSGDDVEELDSYTYPKSAWLVVENEGAISDDILGNAWNCIYEDFLPQNGYRQAELPTIENYIEWNNEKDFCKIEIRIPIEK